MWQRTKNIYHFGVALFANLSHRFPSKKLKVIGVTGTSGKTTTAVMIYEILKAGGYKVSVLSTIKAVIGGKEYDTGFHVTTPDSHKLPKYFKEAVRNGDDFVVLEVSSHALDQHRVAFVRFDIGVLTTLAHEHLDYHKTFENYAKAKFKLLHRARKVVLPYEGVPFKIKKAVGFDEVSKKAITFGIAKGDITQKKLNLSLKMQGKFNTLNGLAAAAVGEILGIPEKIIKTSLEQMKSLPGRFEEIPTRKDFRVIIDFAHKPDALEAVLRLSRQLTHGRVLVLFGCASQRDVLKRSIMGEISARLAEITVLTDEDPRYEDPLKIINEIAVGCVRAEARELSTINYELLTEKKEHFFFKIPDRKEAIEFVISKLAKKGDIVLLCGKGHETSMNYRGVERPYNEHEVVRNALKL